MSQTIKYKTEDIELDINYSPEDETVWLTQKQIATLFNKARSAIIWHIKNIITETTDSDVEAIDITPHRSVDKIDTSPLRCVKKLDIPTNKMIKHYDLETVLEIGRRIGSDRGLLLKKFLDDYLNQEVIDNKQDIIIYNNGNIKLDVKISPEEDTVWLTQENISLLFERDRSVISRHIDNIFEEGELDEKSNVHFLQIPFSDKPVLIYSLDVILSVGYRVKSRRAIEFRRWASSVLKRYLYKGYVIDKARVMVTTENFVQLENDIYSLKTRMDKVEKQVFEEPPKEKLFYNGEYYNAYEFLSSLIRKAKERIIIIDPYLDNKVLTFLKNKNTNVNATIYGSSKSKLKEEEINMFTNQFGGSLIYKTSELFHDRFLILDSLKCYSLGTSLNYMGNKVFSIYEFKDQEILNALLHKVESI